MRTTLLGETVSMPIGLSPTALHGWLWPDGEVNTFQGEAICIRDVVDLSG